jgi:hypothetical protein
MTTFAYFQRENGVFVLNQFYDFAWYDPESLATKKNQFYDSIL